MEFLQAAIFHLAFLDMASGEYIRLPEGMDNMANKFKIGGMAKKDYEDAWNYLGKYQEVFGKFAFQLTLVALNSHWDWYVRKLTEFILKFRDVVPLPPLSPADSKRLSRVGSASMAEQLEILEIAGGFSFQISESDRLEVKELALVRNLGLHNRWETDERYLERTPRQGWSLGEIRTVEAPELQRWHALMVTLLNQASSKVSLAFGKAPNYP